MARNARTTPRWKWSVEVSYGNGDAGEFQWWSVTAPPLLEACVPSSPLWLARRAPHVSIMCSKRGFAARILPVAGCVGVADALSEAHARW